tara:strand:+ start:725 stop:979 length:255 start_codon:yes stop_codon:yes gene_type:complete
MNDYKQGTQEYALQHFRMLRDAKLTESDWIVIKEREEGGSVKNFADWKTYRQALRDMTNDYTVPLNEKGFVDEYKISWPKKPSE